MIYLIDSGHGGFINGKYVTAPSKMHKFNNSEIAYEGVINREIKKLLINHMLIENIRYIDICPTEFDLSLDARVDIANRYCTEFGTSNCLFISLHSNAGGGNGFEIWTTRGQTLSDKYATRFYKKFSEYFPDITMRKDFSDGDADKESNFYVLANTKCSAILPEFLFFDNYQDYQKLTSFTYQGIYVDMMISFMKECNINPISL